MRDLFGWEAQDNPMGPDMVYTMLKLNGKDVGALYQKGEEMKEVPTHWAVYVGVTSADETAAKAKVLGGTVVQEPFDVMEHRPHGGDHRSDRRNVLYLATETHKGVGVKRRDQHALLERAADE